MQFRLNGVTVKVLMTKPVNPLCEIYYFEWYIGGEHGISPVSPQDQRECASYPMDAIYHAASAYNSGALVARDAKGPDPCTVIVRDDCGDAVMVAMLFPSR